MKILKLFIKDRLIKIENLFFSRFDFYSNVIKLFFCLILFFWGHLYAESKIPLFTLDSSFSEKMERLIPLEGQVIQLRGFWYPLKSGEGILASQTNLKSCCLNSIEQLSNQFLVRGDVDSLIPNRAVTLEGFLKIILIDDIQSDKREEKDKRTPFQRFVLEQSKSVKLKVWEQSKLSYGCMILGGLLLGIMAFNL